jgi:aminotransferase
MRRPDRLERLPQQYFVNLLARISAAAADGGPPVLDLGRGNPETGPPPHVVEALRAAALDPGVHGYAPIRGIARTREAIAARYRDVYGVTLDPDTEVAVIPGTKAAHVELALALCDEGDTVLFTDPYYPDYPSGSALAGARVETVQLQPELGWAPALDAAPAASALYLNYPSNPCAVCAPDGVFDDAVAWARRTGGAVVHDAAYIDIVFDGRRPESFLSAPGAKDIGVEMWTMSKTYGMAGWRIGFVVGNAEIVERINLFNDHTRVGIFAPLQHAAIAALEGPQDSVAERVAAYERRRDVISAALPGAPASEGTFYMWLRLPEGLTADQLLIDHRVAVAPGEGFGPSGAGWARLSVAVTDAEIELGAERLNRAFATVVA